MQVIRNYVNATKAIGGEQIYETEDGGTLFVTLKITTENIEAWVQVRAASNGMYQVDLVEKELMTQAVTANADSMAGSLKETGKVANFTPINSPR